MADIFISYKREDILLAKSLAAKLIEAGYTVWWDHDIPAGKDYDRVIEEALNNAGCVIVFWSAASVNSRNVKDEANEGLKRNCLIPVLIGDVRQPLGFRMIQAIQWSDGRTIEPMELEELLTQIGQMIGQPDTSSKTTFIKEPQHSNRHNGNARNGEEENVNWERRKPSKSNTKSWVIPVIILFVMGAASWFGYTILIGAHTTQSNNENTLVQTNNISSSYPGKFPIASQRLLTQEDITGLNKWDLKVMRNEIFARHGYIFKTPDMKTYFENQPWYSGTEADVTRMLSPTEQQNVSFIKKHE